MYERYWVNQMEVIDLKNLIKQNQIPHFMIFTGEEYMAQKIYIQQIAKVMNLKVQYVDAVADIAKSLGNKSLFSENHIYIVHDDKEFMQSDKASEIISKLKSDILILTLTTLDKRLKFIKTYNSSIVDFKPLKSENLKVYIKREIDLSDRNIDILMEICEYNYGHCLLEIDKIWKYVDGCVREYGKPCDVDINGVFKSLLEDGTLYIPPRDTIWDFVKAVLQNKPKLAYELLQDCKEIGEATLIIISNLYNQTKWTMQVQNCKSKNIEKSTGLTYWQIKNAKECVGRFNNEDLEYLMRLCQNIEVRIKQGKIEEQIAVDYILAKFY